VDYEVVRPVPGALAMEAFDGANSCASHSDMASNIAHGAVRPFAVAFELVAFPALVVCSFVRKHV
jgi:hypothetical protein